MLVYAVARGVAASTWTKASVAIKNPTTAEVEVMQEAADSLLHSTGEKALWNAEEMQSYWSIGTPV